MGTVIEEADETVFWLELLIETGLVSKDPLEQPACRGQRTRGDFRGLADNGKERLAFFNRSITIHAIAQ
jgi:hypothetical protein